MSYNAYKNFNSTAKDFNFFRVVHGGKATVSGEKWSTFREHARLAPNRKAKKATAGNDNTYVTPSAA